MSKWVSTKAEKRVAVLEEFTGVRCQYCPDGHRIANELKNSYPGKVISINIHAGVYANPGSGDLDLRTQVSTDVDAAAKVSGYPAGSVSRSTNPWAVSRSSWAGMVTNIISQNSPVNIAVRAVYDESLQKIKTDVEVYYTGDPVPGDKIQVYLLQDSILGNQIGGSSLYPTNFKDGKYIHNHALRMSLTGNSWGIPVMNAEKGKILKSTFISDIPAMIGNVATNPSQFKVVAFVVQSDNNNIYTGDEHKVEISSIDPSKLVDIGLTDKTIYPTSRKAAPIHPRVEVYNNSDKTITGFTLQLDFNGEIILNRFEGTLEGGGKTLIEWDEINPKGGANTINIKGIYDISPEAYDITSNPINSAIRKFVVFNEKAFTNTTVGFDGSYQDYVYLDDEQNKYFYMQNSSNPLLGANGTSGAMWYVLDASQIGQIMGKAGYIMLGECDLRTASSAKLSYYWAYSDGNKSGTAPTIRVEASLDYGDTWSVIHTTECTQTGTVQAGLAWYLPKQGEYKNVEVDLADYLKKGILLRVAGIPGTTGNSLWIDEISVVTESIAEGPKVSVSTKLMDFGAVDVDKDKDMKLIITNSGDEDLTFYSALVTGKDRLLFEITAGNEFATINPGETHEVTVKYSPKSDLSHAAVLTISTNGKNEASTEIALRGKGNPVGNVPYGETSDGSMTIAMVPNPVYGSSNFVYTVNNSVNSNVKIVVVDISGKVVSELVNGSIPGGEYSMNFSAEYLPAGLYYVYAESDGKKAGLPIIITK